MIYLLDDNYSENSHSKFITDIISRHTSVEIKIISLPENPTYGDLYKIINDLFSLVMPSDIVLCPWLVNGDDQLDEMFNNLSDICWVVVAAGNYNLDIKDYSPARANGVITVACLNKAGTKAALSNWSNTKELIWIPGYKYDVGWKKSSGTSVSSAIYAACLAESIKFKDPSLLDKLIKNYTDKVIKDLTSTHATS